MTEAKDIQYWQTFSVRDAEVMMAWLRAVGFREHATYRDEEDPSIVVHAEWLWEGGGGVMFGSRRSDGILDNEGRSAAYLVDRRPRRVVRPSRGRRSDRAARDGRPGLRRPRRLGDRSRRQPLVRRRLPAVLTCPVPTKVGAVCSARSQRSDPARRGRPRADARAGLGDGARRDGLQRPRGRRLHLGDLHRHVRPGQRVPGVRRAPAGLRRGAADLRARARDRGLHAPGGADDGARRDRPAAGRHHPLLPARGSCAALAT